MARRVGVWFAAPYKVKSRSGPVRSDRPSVRVAVTKANQPANSCVRTSGLRATSATPAKRGGAVGAPEGLHEVARIAVADPPANLLNREVLLWSRRRPVPLTSQGATPAGYHLASEGAASGGSSATCSPSTPGLVGR